MLSAEKKKFRSEDSGSRKSLSAFRNRLLTPRPCCGWVDGALAPPSIQTRHHSFVSAETILERSAGYKNRRKRWVRSEITRLERRTTWILVSFHKEISLLCLALKSSFSLFYTFVHICVVVILKDCCQDDQEFWHDLIYVPPHPHPSTLHPLVPLQLLVLPWQQVQVSLLRLLAGRPSRRFTLNFF